MTSPHQVDVGGNNSSPTDAQADTLQSLLLDASNAQGRKAISRNAKAQYAITTLVSFARNVDRFSQALDVYVQGGTAVASIIWGSLRLVIKAILDHAIINEKISATLVHISENLERFSRYQTIFATSSLLQTSIGALYGDIEQFAKQVAKFYSRSNFRVILGNLWKSEDYQFDRIIANIHRHNDLVRDQALLASFEGDRLYRENCDTQYRDKSRQDLDSWIIEQLQDPNWIGAMKDKDPAEYVRNGTCQWILPVFMSWLHTSTSSSMFVYGNPGTGKSHMASVLVTHLQQDLTLDGTLVVPIHPQQRPNKTWHISEPKILLLQHLLRGHNPTTESINLFSVLRRSISYAISPAETDHCLRSSLPTILILLRVRRAYLIVDGIEILNAQEQCRLMQDLVSLNQIFGTTGCVFKVTVMSRPLCFLRLSQYSSTLSRIDLTTERIRHDLRLYIQHSLKTSASQGIVHARPDDEITSAILERSNDYFPLAQGILEDLQSASMNPRGLFAEAMLFDSIPHRLQNSFKELTEKIQSEATSYKACQILAAAVSSIPVQDLDTLLWAASRDGQLPGIGSACDRTTDRPYEIVAGMVASEVQFFHPVFKEYLLSRDIIDMKDCHALMAIACLNIAALHSPTIAGLIGNPSDGSNLLRHIRSRPGLDYAIRHWSHHFKSSECFGVIQPYTSIIEDRLRTARYLVNMEDAISNEMNHSRSSENSQSLNLEARSAVLGSSHTDTIITRMHVAQDAQRRGDVTSSYRHYAVVCDCHGFDELVDEHRYQALSGMARSCERQNRWEDAEAVYLRCLKLCSSAESPWVQRTIETQNSLGWVLKARGRTQMAVKIYGEACCLAEEQHGAGHPETRLSIQNIANIYERTGKKVLAKLILQHHLDRCDYRYGPGHSRTIDTLLDLLSFLERQSEGEESQSICRQLLDRCKRLEISPLEIGQILARSYEAHGQFNEAEVALKELYNHLEASEEASGFMTTFARFFMRRESWLEANVLLQQCLDTHGENLAWRAHTELMLLIAECKQRMGQPRKAHDSINEFIRLRDRNCQWKCREDININNDLGEYYERHHKWADASEVYLHIHGNILDVFGPKHKYSISTEQAMAAYAERIRDWKEAERLYRGIGKDIVETRGTRHRSTIAMWKKHLLTKLYELQV